MENDVFKKFKQNPLLESAARIIKAYNVPSPIKIMEVCGTHTTSIFKYGIHSLLPRNVKIISGPGCPVCVTSAYYIDVAIQLALNNDILIATFGDMLKVPGTNSSISNQISVRGNVFVVYSPFEALKIAKDNPCKKVVFLSVGFETTSAIIALVIIAARKENIKNFYVLTSNKTIPNALCVLTNDKNVKIDGFIYPGHVGAIIGANAFKSVSQECNIPGVVAGFEPLDILYAIMKLIDNIPNKDFLFENLYSRVVSKNGNIIAQQKMYEVFEEFDADWRGIGVIPKSGLKLKPNYQEFDAFDLLKDELLTQKKEHNCQCGEILKGIKSPPQCILFANPCSPENPLGACMISSEGACAAYYKYRDKLNSTSLQG